MEQYIPKAALVAEIERLREDEYPCDTFEESTGYYNALDEIAAFINTLEVKEIGIDVGSPKGDLGKKTVQVIDADGNISEVTFYKAQKGE